MKESEFWLQQARISSSQKVNDGLCVALVMLAQGSKENLSIWDDRLKLFEPDNNQRHGLWWWARESGSDYHPIASSGRVLAALFLYHMACDDERASAARKKRAK